MDHHTRPNWHYSVFEVVSKSSRDGIADVATTLNFVCFQRSVCLSIYLLLKKVFVGGNSSRSIED